MVELDENGLNKKIEFHCKSDEAMKRRGFRWVDQLNRWYKCVHLVNDITFNIEVYKEKDKRGTIEILDEEWLQPYDYQEMLSKNPHFEFAICVKGLVEEELDKLTRQGIITGWKKGMYV